MTKKSFLKKLDEIIRGFVFASWAFVVLTLIYTQKGMSITLIIFFVVMICISLITLEKWLPNLLAMFGISLFVFAWLKIGSDNGLLMGALGLTGALIWSMGVFFKVLFPMNSRDDESHITKGSSW